MDNRLTRPRKTRSDKGRVLPTTRDYELLRTIGNFKLLRMDDFCWELGKDRGCAVSLRTAQGVAERLKRLHFIKCAKFEYGQPAYIWATTPGMRFADLPYTYWEPRSIDRIHHPYAVYRVYRYLSENPNYIIHWFRTDRALEHYEPDREHTTDIEASLTYIPTGITQKVPIEVERIQKSASRNDFNLRYLTENYDTVFYFVADGAWTGIEKAVARLEETERAKVKMKSLDALWRTQSHSS
jgi:hypothetical protein